MKNWKSFLALVALLTFNFAPTAGANDLVGLRETTEVSYSLIGVQDAHNLGFKGKDQVIVFIDDGVDASHPYLKEAVIDGFCSSRAACGEDFLKSGVLQGGLKPPTNPSVHGMMVAGIIAGRANSNAPGGVAPEAKVISITNTNGNNEGLFAAFDWILEAKKRYNIVAMSGSFGIQNFSDRSDLNGCLGPSSELDTRIKALADAGIIPVFAAGNDSNPFKTNYPSCLPSVVSVGATTAAGKLQGYSNVSGKMTVLAPSDVMSASQTGNYFLSGGTSAAAPVVAGAVALLKEAKPSATVDEIKRALQSTNRYLSDIYWRDIPILHIPTAIKSIQSGNYIPARVIGGDGQGAVSKEVTAEAETLKKELIQVNSQVVTLTNSIKSLEDQLGALKKRLKSICKAKPRPRGC